MKKIDLSKTTFIIPILIEHKDRYRNAKTTLEYLNHHFKTNAFIYESSSDGNSKLDFLDSLKDLKIKKWTIEPEGIFHRTKYLNIMLDLVETPVVVNYDIDVILSPENYLESQNLIVNNEADVVYPYEFGIGQKRVSDKINLNEFKKSGFDINYIDSRKELYDLYNAEYGHCIFFNTGVYRKNGAENENFISYGPEDRERGERFKRLDFRVIWRNEYFVYHFEHYRGNDSSSKNPYFDHNWKIYRDLNELYEKNSNEYFKFYFSPEYSKKYKNIGNN